MANLVEDVLAEMLAGDAKHGPFSRYPDGTRAGGMNLVQREQAKNACDRAFREGRGTAAHVLEEEFWEAMCEEDPVALRAELVQVAAVACKWIEKLDKEAKARG